MNRQAWLDRAKEKGFDGLEIYRGRSAERRVAWFGGQMDSFVTSDVTGTFLRADIGGRTANLALEKTDDAKIDETLDLLAEQAEIVSQKEPDVLRYPEPAEEAKSGKEWKIPAADEILSKLAEIEKAVLAADPRIRQVTEIGGSHPHRNTMHSTPSNTSIKFFFITVSFRFCGQA